MGRLSILLLAAVAAAFNPDLRARLSPYAERGLDPVYEWTARYRVGEIVRALGAEVAAERPLPGPGGLQPFLERRYPGSLQPLDPWRSPYFLRRDRWEARVGSAGRDRTPGTRDDILSPPLLLPRS